MMSDDERYYFRERAEAEIRAAQAAVHPEAAKAHYVLAGYYLDLSYNPVGPSAARAIDSERLRASSKVEPVLR
jgi:hypothetical protein